MAAALVGANRETRKAYFGYFLRHWSWGKDTFNDVLEVFVDNFMRPGNLEGGFAHYKGTQGSRIALMKGEAPKLPLIEIPTCVRWAEHDPVLPYAWTDHLSDTFAHLDLAQFPDVGHFPHREDPEHAAEEIASFFKRIVWG